MKKETTYKIIALSGVPLIMVLGNSMLIPVFPQIKQVLGISSFQVSLLITLFSIPAGLSIPFLGFFSDKFGRKKIIVPSLILYGLGGLISGFAPIFFKSNVFTVLLAGRIVQGIGAAGTAPIAMALVGDIFTSSERSKGLGTIEAANGVGKVLSPILGSLLGLIIWYSLFFVYAVLAVPVAIAVWLLIKEPPVKEPQKPAGQYFQGIKEIFQYKGGALGGAYLAGSMVLLILFGILAYLSDVLEDQYGLQGVVKGLALAVPVLAMSVTAYLTGHYLQKQPQKIKPLLVLGLIITTVAMVAIALIKNNWASFIGVFCTGVGTGLVLPGVNTLVTSAAPLEKRGGITALYGSVRFFGVAAGPPLFALLLNLGKPAMFLGGGFLAGLAAVVGTILINEQLLLQPEIQPAIPATSPGGGAGLLKWLSGLVNLHILRKKV
jgi:ACDE family multidrug resistance protein